MPRDFYARRLGSTGYFVTPLGLFERGPSGPVPVKPEAYVRIGEQLSDAEARRFTGGFPRHSPVADWFGAKPTLSAMKALQAMSALQGKRTFVDIQGFGRTKAYDPLLNRTYDLESGEVPPGFRGGGGAYTPEEFAQIQERLASRPSLSALEREAAVRLSRAGLGAIRPAQGYGR